MLIRDAKPEDMPAVARVHVDSWRTTYRNIVPAAYLANLSYKQREMAFRDTLTHEGIVFFVAEDASEGIVGFVSGGPERSNDPVYRGELYAIYLLANRQRHGVGTAMFAALAKSLKAAGFDSMLALVLVDNPACSFYERLGGKRVRTLSVSIGGQRFVEAVYGWRDLSPLTI
jgi:ribosomal protein S18 acetylase RimI-like enzyme